MLSPQPRLHFPLWAIGVVVVPALVAFGWFAPSDSSTAPEGEVAGPAPHAGVMESVAVVIEESAPRNPGRSGGEVMSNDPLGTLFGAAVRVADRAAQVASAGGDDKAIQALIEVTADGFRSGIDVADTLLPPLDPSVAREFGRVFRDDLLAKHRRLADTRAEKIILPVWKEVVQATGEAPETLTITLIDDLAMNAFAFVGRNVVVNKGFVDFAARCDRPTDVVRFALAHELGHIICGHTDTLLRRVVAVEQFVPGAGIAPAIAESIVKQTPISQAAEREADCFARSLLLKNGWTLDGGKEFFERVQRMSGRPSSVSSIDSLFGSHPDEKRRVDLLESGDGCRR
jgi:hypothetical protein